MLEVPLEVRDLTLSKCFSTFPQKPFRQHGSVWNFGSAKGVAMMIDAKSMRKAVLSEIFDHLVRTYGIELRRDEFTGGMLSSPEIEGILSFKSDPHLDELHDALRRIEQGTYGVCLGCKHEIGDTVLQKDPSSRMCSVCDHEYSKPVTHLSQVHYH
jgi:hypothetical protein